MNGDPSRGGLLLRVPSDFRMHWRGDYVEICGTCETTHHLEALAECLLAFRGCLPATREAVPGDFGIEPSEPSYAEQLDRFLGCYTTPKSARLLPIMRRQKGGLTRAEQRQSERTGA